MILGILKIPERAIREYDGRRPLRMGGDAGRRIRLSPFLLFYKFIVQHGNMIIEYIMASTQDFDLSTNKVVEQVTGIVSAGMGSVHLVPVGMKVITQDTCDNFLFVNTVEYLLMYFGPPRPHGEVMEITSPPSRLSHVACGMCSTYTSNVVSLNYFVRNLSENSYGSDVPPSPLYSLDISPDIAKDGQPNKIDIRDIVTVNDLGIYKWLFDSLHIAGDVVHNNGYPLLPDGEFAMIGSRFDVIRQLATTEPVCGACLSTPSYIKLASLLPFISRKSPLPICNHQTALSMEHGFMQGSAMGELMDEKTHMLTGDSQHPDYGFLEFDNLIMATIYSPVVNLEIIKTHNSMRVVSASTWYGDAEATQYGGIARHLSHMLVNLEHKYQTTSVELHYVKTWLDEAYLKMTINGMSHITYFPLQMISMVSPCLVNKKTLELTSTIFGLI